MPPEVDFSQASLERMSFEPALVSAASFEALQRDRRLAEGPTPSALTTLSKAHRACLALHLSGATFGEIAARLQKPASWVLRTLRDPLVRRVIDEVLAVSDMEMAALLPLANAAVRQQLVHGSGQQKLRAADIALRANHKYVEQPDAKSTAEDVIQQILSFASGIAGKAMEMATQQPLRDAGLPNTLAGDYVTVDAPAALPSGEPICVAEGGVHMMDKGEQDHEAPD